MIKINKVIWDNWNVDHISKHGVTVKEVERALKDRRARSKLGHTDRVMVLGSTESRLLSIVVAKEENGSYYVVTARDMDKKERK